MSPSVSDFTSACLAIGAMVGVFVALETASVPGCMTISHCWKTLTGSAAQAGACQVQGVLNTSAQLILINCFGIY